MALMGAAFASGFALGPAIGGILAPFGVAVPFYVAGCMGLGAAVLTALILPETGRQAAAAAPRRRTNPLAVGAIALHLMMAREAAGARAATEPQMVAVDG